MAGSGDEPRPALAARFARALVLPLLTERVDVAAAYPAVEVERRLDARTKGGRRLYGSGVAVARRSGGYRLVERNVRLWPGRPRCFVRVVPDGGGARVTGVLRATRPGWLAYVAVLAGLVAVAASGSRELWALLSLPTAWVVLAAVIHVDERESLRRYLDDLLAYAPARDDQRSPWRHGR